MCDAFGYPYVSCHDLDAQCNATLGIVLYMYLINLTAYYLVAGIASSSQLVLSYDAADAESIDSTRFGIGLVVYPAPGPLSLSDARVMRSRRAGAQPTCFIQKNGIIAPTDGQAMSEQLASGRESKYSTSAHDVREVRFSVSFGRERSKNN